MLCERNQEHQPRAPDAFRNKEIQTFLENFSAVMEDLPMDRGNRRFLQGERI